MAETQSAFACSVFSFAVTGTHCHSAARNARDRKLCSRFNGNLKPFRRRQSSSLWSFKQRRPCFIYSSQQETDKRLDNILDALKKELPIMFEPDTEVDYTLYSPNVIFQDPLSRFEGAAKYAGNISFLRTFFKDGKLELHDSEKRVLKDGRPCITTRWTLSMTSPIPWRPRMAFTGTSDYVIGEDGLVVEHIDKWDSVAPSDGFLDGLVDMFKEFFVSGSGAPNPNTFLEDGEVENAPYRLLRRYKTFEIREYIPRVDLTTPYTSRVHGFSLFSEFFSGNNSFSTTLRRTAPVIYQIPSTINTTLLKYMSVPLPSKYHTPENSPQPLAEGLKCVQAGGELVAVKRFNGSASESVVVFNKKQLLNDLKQTGWGDQLDEGELEVSSFCQYNPVYSLIRKNEVWLKLTGLKEGFDYV